MKRTTTLNSFSILSILFISLSFIFAIQSCDKHFAKKVSGTYACQIHSTYWDMSQNNNLDTTYLGELKVEKDGKFVVVKGHKVHADSLRSGKEYVEGHYSNFFKLKIYMDSIYFTQSSGGLGGGGTTEYVGTYSGK